MQTPSELTEKLFDAEDQSDLTAVAMLGLAAIAAEGHTTNAYTQDSYSEVWYDALQILSSQDQMSSAT